MSMFKNLNVAYVHVSDWERAKKFYREVLEWPIVYSDDEVGWEEYGRDHEAHFAINRWTETGEPPHIGGTIVFTVDDPFKTTEALRAKGVKCDEVMVIPQVVTYGTFYDGEGNRFQFTGGGE
jgi:predicted enzyme related to lactoylglutathione lyase